MAKEGTSLRCGALISAKLIELLIISKELKLRLQCLHFKLPSSLVTKHSMKDFFLDLTNDMQPQTLLIHQNLDVGIQEYLQCYFLKLTCNRTY